MQVNTFLNINIQNIIKKEEFKDTQNNLKDHSEKLNTLTGKNLSDAYLLHFEQEAMNIASDTSNAQALFNTFLENDKAKSMLLNIDLISLGYEGKNPLNMDMNELKELISEEGFFGVNNTANRIADLIIKGANDDIEKLKKGFEGMQKGFNEAEKIWGGKLPQISQDTMDKALKKVSDRISKLNTKSLNLEI